MGSVFVQTSACLCHETAHTLERALAEELGDLGLCQEPDVLAKCGGKGGFPFQETGKRYESSPEKNKQRTKMLPRIDGPGVSAYELPS